MKIGKILLTLSAIMYGIIPLFVDLNSTHAMNHEWVGHARFHVVWQILITFNLSLLSFYLTWNKKIDAALSLRLSFLVGLIVLGSFDLNGIIKNLYGGTFTDESGYKSSAIGGFDPNLIAFNVALVLLISGYLIAKNKLETKPK